jgi:hypothetical protein
VLEQDPLGRRNEVEEKIAMRPLELLQVSEVA